MNAKSNTGFPTCITSKSKTYTWSSSVTIKFFGEKSPCTIVDLSFSNSLIN